MSEGVKILGVFTSFLATWQISFSLRYKCLTGLQRIHIGYAFVRFCLVFRIFEFLYENLQPLGGLYDVTLYAL